MRIRHVLNGKVIAKYGTSYVRVQYLLSLSEGALALEVAVVGAD